MKINIKVLIIMICLILCFIISVGDVCATDINSTDQVLSVSETNTDITTINVEEVNTENNTLQSSVEQEVLQDDATSVGSYSDLDILVQGSDGLLLLDRNYTFDSSVDGDNYRNNGIIVSRSITIDGNGYTINGSSLARGFTVNANNVIFTNLNFVNTNIAILITGDDCQVLNSNFSNGTNGAVRLQGANGKVFNSTFTNITSSTNGAVYVSGSGEVLDSKFVKCSNTAYWGAAISIPVTASSVSVRGCSFIECEVKASSYFAGIVYTQRNSYDVIENCSFISNVVASSYYGLFAQMNSLKCVNCHFINNTYPRLAYSVIQEFYNCTFENEVSNSYLLGYGDNGSCNNLIVDNCNFTNISNVVIQLSVGASHAIKNSQFINCSSPITLTTSSSFTTINNCNFTDCINIAGVDYNVFTDDRGSASLAVNLPVGSYDALVNVDNYSLHRVVTVLSTIESADFSKLYMSDNVYYVRFFDGEGNYLSNGMSVLFSINGVNYTRRVSGDEGLAKLNINLPVGDYVVGVINLVTGESNSNVVHVVLSIVNNQDLVKYYKNGSNFAVQIIDSSLNPVSGETVVFTINGVRYTRQSDENGWARISINLVPGDYVITTSQGDYDVTNNVKVLLVLYANDLTVAYGSKSRFEVGVVDGYGNPFSNQPVTFYINGVSYNRVSNSDGIAGLNINLPAGEYIISSEYMGLNTTNKVTVYSG